MSRCYREIQSCRHGDPAGQPIPPTMSRRRSSISSLMRAISKTWRSYDNDKDVISRTVINAFSKRAFYTSSNSTLVLRFVSESYAPLITSRLMLKKGPFSCKDIEALLDLPSDGF